MKNLEKGVGGQQQQQRRGLGNLTLQQEKRDMNNKPT